MVIKFSNQSHTHNLYQWPPQHMTASYSTAFIAPFQHIKVLRPFNMQATQYSYNIMHSASCYLLYNLEKYRDYNDMLPFSLGPVSSVFIIELINKINI